MQRLKSILRHPLLLFFVFLISVYLSNKIEWYNSLFSLSVFKHGMAFSFLLFQVLLFVLLLANLYISIGRIASNSELRSRFWKHCVTVIIGMLLLSFLTLLVLVFSSSNKIDAALRRELAQEIAEHTIFEEISAPDIEQRNKQDSPFALFEENQNSFEKIYRHYNRYFFPELSIFFMLISVLFTLIFALYSSVLQKKEKSQKKLRISEICMRCVQYLAMSLIKAVETILCLAPFFLFLVIPYVFNALLNAELIHLVMRYFRVFYGYALGLFLLSLILIFFVAKISIKNIVKGLYYPSIIAFVTGSSVAALYDSVQGAVRYLRVNPLEARYYLPLYTIIARFGHTVYLVFLTFLLSQIFSLLLGPVEFIMLSVYASVFSLISVGTNNSTLLYFQPFFLYAVDIPLVPAVILIMGIDAAFAPMRSAITTCCGITLLTLIEKKDEKNN